MSFQTFPIIFSLLLISTLFSNTTQASSQKLTRHTKPNDVLRFEITEPGIYWLSYEDFVKAGVQPQLIDPKRLRLFNQSEEVAIQIISAQSDRFNPGDFLVFYAHGLDTTFTQTNVYWLYWRKKGFGKRMALLDGAVTAESEPIKTFYEPLHFEQNRTWDIWRDSPDEQDYWFWHRINATETKEINVTLPALPLEQTEVVIRVGFRGRSTAPPAPNHHTLIYWNDTLVGDERWDGDIEYIQEMSVASALIQKNNTLTIELPGDTGANVETVYLNWIELDYWRSLEAVKNKLVFTVTGDENSRSRIEINKLSQSDIFIYDITHPNEVAAIVNFSVAVEESHYRATFADTLPEAKTYYLATLDQLKQPSNLTLWQPGKLKSIKNGADYILITAREFLPAVEPLCELRRRQGLRVKSVSVEDIYNEFNDGIFDPAAIKAFLRYAYENWSQPAPSYVFLVGDATVDYRGYLKGAKKKNQVPAHLYLSVGDKSLLIPNDNWYVDVWEGYWGNYILPEMMIGRMPGDTPETVSKLIDKIIHYEESTEKSPQQVLLVSDASQEEENLNNGLIDYLPAEFNVDKVYLRAYLQDVETDKQKNRQIAKATRHIMASINDGAMITNYAGHGTVDRWSQSKGLFKPENVHNLKNQDNLTFVLALTCINGDFSNSSKYALAEEFLLAPGGAIGVFSSSGLTYTLENEALSQEVFSTIFELGYRTLGEITTQAKIAAYNKGIPTGVIQSFILFGDPALKLKDW